MFTETTTFRRLRGYDWIFSSVVSHYFDRVFPLLRSGFSRSPPSLYLIAQSLFTLHNLILALFSLPYYLLCQQQARLFAVYQ